MRHFPEDDYDRKEAARLGAEPWMLDILKLNPEYCGWGPHEDYMIGKDQGWRSPIFVPSWSEFAFPLDELNECVHFYFQIHRESAECDCGGSGYNPETRRIADDFYDFDHTGRKWNDRITQDECDALVENGRLREWDKEKCAWRTVPRTAEEVNAANRGGGLLADMHHDAINRGILVETRARRLGVWGLCPKCDGHGSVYTEPACHLSLVLWMLHPRKGASRGVEVQRVEREQLPAVYAWLGEAAKRNAERFAKVLAQPQPRETGEEE